MPDPNTEHGLRVQLATALREVELWKIAKRNCAESNQRLRDEVLRLRAEVKRLREAFMGLRETYGLVLAFAREVLGVLERGEDSHVLRVPDRTMKLLRCTDPIPTADDVVSDARAALCAGGDRG